MTIFRRTEGSSSFSLYVAEREELPLQLTASKIKPCSATVGQTCQLFLHSAAPQQLGCVHKPSLQHVVAGSSSFSSLHEIMNQVPLDSFWCAKSRKNAHTLVCRMLRLSVCQRGKVTGSSVGRARFPVCQTDLSLQVCFFSFFSVRKGSFASVATMKKPSVNSGAGPSQDPFCREPVNVADASESTNVVTHQNVRILCVRELSRGFSAHEPGGPLHILP